MKTIKELTSYLGYFKSNENFEAFLLANLLDLSEYDNESGYITCNKSKIEIGFTNERIIRKGDENKLLTGGKPIFTHFIVYPESNSLFEILPFAVTFADSLEVINLKAGKPDEIFESDNFLTGKTKSYHYFLEKFKVIFVYDLKIDSLRQISIEQKEKFIIEESIR